MVIQQITLAALVVNRANDRHGELENETAAIAWLFNAHKIRMRNLAKDIVEKGEIYESPLVYPEKDTFIVFDGNRRVTCLKLLEDPRRAPTSKLQAFFREQRGLWRGPFPQIISCQVETDRDRIDEILFRRHTGTQNGVGQSTWNDRMKATFVSRTGKGGRPCVADEVEKRLADAHLLPAQGKIPRSTLNRLLSAEPLRQRVGISMKGGRFQFIGDENASLAALARIANDLASSNIVLSDIWDVDGKRGYLNQLENEDILPISNSNSSGKFNKTLDTHKPLSNKTTLPTTRNTLIPQKNFGIDWPGRLQRHHQIWEELQFHLDLQTHVNAISVLMRVLIELSLENYIQQARVNVHENDKLATRLEKAGLHLQKAGKIDAKQMDVIKKFKQGEKMISADTLNKYIHSQTFTPSPEHLTSMWDSLASVIVHFLNA